MKSHWNWSFLRFFNFLIQRDLRAADFTKFRCNSAFCIHSGFEDLLWHFHPLLYSYMFCSSWLNTSLFESMKLTVTISIFDRHSFGWETQQNVNFSIHEINEMQVYTNMDSPGPNMMLQVFARILGKGNVNWM